MKSAFARSVVSDCLKEMVKGDEARMKIVTNQEVELIRDHWMPNDMLVVPLESGWHIFRGERHWFVPIEDVWRIYHQALDDVLGTGLGVRRADETHSLEA